MTADSLASSNLTFNAGRLENPRRRRTAHNLDGPAPVGTHAEAKGEALSVQCFISSAVRSPLGVGRRSAEEVAL
jgi:hypothetical protein